MEQNRRTLLRQIGGLSAGVLVMNLRPSRSWARQAPGGQLAESLPGTWSLQSYSYTSNGRTYSVPDEMEGTVIFTESTYSVEFAAYIGAAGIRRTRRSSELGTYSINGNRVELFAEEASSDSELGEEALTEVQIEGDVMNLVSNNGNNTEVWKKVEPAE